MLASMECCALPPFSVNCHCGRCHVTFATLDSFEAHLIRNPGEWVIRGCLAPGSLGLVADDRGTWRTPEGLERRNTDAARLAARRNAPADGPRGA